MSRLLSVLLITVGALLTPAEGETVSVSLSLDQLDPRAVDIVLNHFNGNNRLKKAFRLDTQRSGFGARITESESSGTLHTFEFHVKETDCPHTAPLTQQCNIQPTGNVRICKGCFSVLHDDSFDEAQKYIDCARLSSMQKSRRGHIDEACARLQHHMRPIVSYFNGVFSALQEAPRVST